MEDSIIHSMDFVPPFPRLDLSFLLGVSSHAVEDVEVAHRNGVAEVGGGGAGTRTHRCIEHPERPRPNLFSNCPSAGHGRLAEI